jgi:hypothetical protein
MQKTAAIVTANDRVIHIAEGRWPSKIKALVPFIRLIRHPISLVDKHPISFCKTLGMNGRITTLWVTRLSILRLYAGHAQAYHAFWTDLSLPDEQAERCHQKVVHRHWQHHST